MKLSSVAPLPEVKPPGPCMGILVRTGVAWVLDKALLFFPASLSPLLVPATNTTKSLYITLILRS